MRALFLTHNLTERGSYFRALEIASRLARLGHEVRFTFTSAQKYYRPQFHRDMKLGIASTGVCGVESPNFTLFNDKQEGWGIPDNAFRISEAVGSRWDLVYGFSHKPDCVLPAIAAKLRGAKIVLDWSDWWGGDEGLFRTCVIPSDHFQTLPRPARWWRRATFAIEDLCEPNVYAVADAVTLISEEFLVHPRAPRNLAQKSIVLHSGSPLRTIYPILAREARLMLGIEFPDNAIVLGYVANYHMDERLLLDTFAEICRERNDVFLLVAGADFEQSDPALHKLTKSNIRHLGRIPFDQMNAFLGASDILLLPLSDIALDRARYPHKLSDYVAAGRPIVACDVGETGRILRKFGFGELAAPNSHSFAGKIMETANAASKWPEMGAATRIAAERYFNWDEMCERLFKFLALKTGIEF